MRSSEAMRGLSAAPNGRRAVLVVVDSLRADLISPETTPALARLADGACLYTAHRSVFPSTTRTASASIATGCLPHGHGLQGNAVALWENGRLERMSTGRADFRDRLRASTGRTLLRPTLAQRVAGAGGCVVFSNASPGAAHFQDPDGHGYLYNRAGSYGPGLRPLAEGAHLEAAKGNAGDAHTTERFVEETLLAGRPALSVLWLSEPDNTGHRNPLGSPEHRAALAGADACVAHVLEAVERLDPDGRELLLVVTSDHGQETTDRIVPVDDLLVQAGLKAAPDSRELVAAPQGTSVLFFYDGPPDGHERALADFLAGQDWVDAVYAGPDLHTVGLAPEHGLRAAASLHESGRTNSYGVPGYSDTMFDPLDGLNHPGCGQHGGDGPYEQGPFLLLRGEGFPTHARRDAPTRPIDVAPTVLRHLGQPTDGMDGRSLQDD